MLKFSDQKQQRHEALIELMNQFDQFRDNKGNPQLKKKLNAIGTRDLVNLSISEINDGVVVLTDFINLPGGSLSDIDLYVLLQCYFLNPAKRSSINKILRS